MDSRVNEFSYALVQVIGEHTAQAQLLREG